MKKQSNLGFLLEISGRGKFKLYLAALFSIISSLLAIVPYILMYNIVLEFFGNTVDYPEIKSIEDVIKAARSVFLSFFILLAE